MIKYLEIPDFHADPAWIEHTIQVGAAVRKAAEENSVDFIALPGDFFNRPLYASDRSQYKKITNIIKDWLSYCPVVAVEGTPSHDGPGAYGPLQDIGLVLLQPGFVYCLKDKDIFGSLSLGPDIPDAVLFGIPELRKDHASSLSTEERAGDTIEGLRRYITEFVGPYREEFPDIPAIGLLHGVVSDSTQDLEADVIKRQSSLLIHTEYLAPAGIDRWSLGDIHTPWESKKICAGYAGFTGMDGNPWGKTGFFPAMNLVEINGDLPFDRVSIKRIPYGTPERRKITAPLDAYDPAVAYWLVSGTDDPTLNPANHGAHPWSRVTFEKKKTETRRATKEQAENATTLSAIAQLWNPDEMTPERAKKLDSIDSGTHSHAYGQSADLQKLTVAGCEFFGGRTATLDAARLPRALNELHGNDNGSGKSSLLCFATPYPNTVGRDTESGRPSAIHEFFNAKDSYIEKRFTVDGQEHRHLISIKGAHTKSASVECFLYIDGENVLTTKSFDHMAEICERLYGPIEDHLLTAFNVQPEQSKNTKSIAASTPTELRERVHRITGIDRSNESTAANAAATELNKESSRLKAMIQARQAEVSELDEKRRYLDFERSEARTEAETLQKAEADTASLLEQVADSHDAAKKSASEAEAKAEADKEILRLQSSNRDDHARILEYETAASSIDEHRTMIGMDNQNRKRRQELSDAREEVASRNRETKAEYDQSVLSYNAELREIEDRRDRAKNLQSNIDAFLEMAQMSEDPCENCGHVKKKAAAAAKANREKAHDAHTELQLLQHKMETQAEPVFPEQPEYERFDGDAELQSLVVMTDNTRAQYEGLIAEANRAEASIEEINRTIAERRERMATLNAKTYQIDAEAEQRYARLTEQLGQAEDAVARQKAALEQKRQLIAKLEGEVETIERAEKQSEKDAAELKKAETELADWSWIAQALRPNKLPAFELDMLLDEIDERATRYVAPFRENRYTIRTETQGAGKTGVVDRFRVMVHDGETGVEKSLLKFSGGEKVFLADAYQKALLDVRKERRGVMHEPVVFDETDGAIRPERIAEYYRMQTDYFAGVRTLVVSHAPDAQNYIQSRVTMDEVLL